jgi:peptidoglycan/LPS O-acetylase OafA/YrhL
MSSPAFQRIIALDGVRGLAVTLLVLSHFMISKSWETTATWKVLHGGWLGVDLFFVLSGFLITGILIDTKQSSTYFGSFFKRRLLRIFPLYYACLIITLLVVYFIEKAPERLVGYDGMGWFFAYASNIAIALKGEWTFQSDWLTMGHFWSLAVEEQFYLVWPFIVYFLPNRPLMWISGLLVFTGPAVKEYFDSFFGQDSLASYCLTPCRMDALGAGAFLASFLRQPYLEEKRGMNKIAIFLAILWLFSVYKGYSENSLDIKWNAAMFLFALFIVLPYRHFIARIMVVYGAIMTAEILMKGGPAEKWTFPILLFFGFIYLAMQDGWVRKFCEHPFLTHMGKYSYAIYIFHHFCKPLWEYGFGDYLFNSDMSPFLAQTLYIIFAGLLTYGLARLSWIIIEKPMLSFKDRWAPVK